MDEDLAMAPPDDQPVPTPVSCPKKATGELSPTDDGISIVLPPMGFYRGSKGLGSFSVLWLGFVTIFTSVFVASWFKNGFKGDDVFFVLFIGVFWLIGAAMAYGAARAGRRRGYIDVVGRDLLISRQAIGRPKSESWHADEIDRIVAGPSGVEVNDVPVIELQVWPKHGKKRGFFPERRDDELRWIAWEIEVALRDAGGIIGREN